MAHKATYEELEQRVKALAADAEKNKWEKEALKIHSLLSEQSSLSIAILDPEGNLEYANPKFLEILKEIYELEHNNIIGKNWRDLFLPDSTIIENLRKIQHRVLDEGIMWQGKLSEITKNGNTIWRDARLFPIKDKTGEIINIVYMSENITYRQAEESLRLDEKRFCSVYDIAPLAFVIWDINIRVTDWNKKAEKVFGWSKEEVIGHNIFDFLIPEKDRPHVEGIVDSLLHGKYPSHSINNNLTKDGKIITCEWNNSIFYDDDGNIIGVASLGLDITERNQANKALLESEERHRSFIDNAPIGIYTINTKGEFTYGNKKLLEMTGYKREDWLNKPFNPIVHPEDIGIVLEKIKRITLSEESSDPYEIRIVTPSGELMWLQITPVSISEKDKSGEKKLIGIQSFAQNITDRKIAEQLLRNSEQRFRELAELLPDTIFEIDLYGKVTFVNQTAFDQFGYTQADFNLGLGVFDMIVSEDRQRALENFQAVLKGEDLELSQYRMLRKDGSNFPALCHATPIIREGKPAGMRGFCIDITEKARLEAQLQQAQKMEAIGTLAGGIAHDFNNMLMVIQGRTSLMLVDLDDDHPHYEHLKGIEDHIRSAANLTKQLLGFARGGKYRVKSIDMNELLKNQTSMFGRTKKEIAIREKYGENLWPVEVDRGQIEQAILNLYVNAWQSMPGGGYLYIQTENITIGENYSKTYYMGPGKYVKISVSDTGLGMDKATRKRIFEPFFTTKEMGRGTGLGLASVYGIIKNHGGFIDVKSEEAAGTTFTLYLPASEKEVEIKKVSSPILLEGSGTILLVDDEETVIEVGSKMLEKMGYTVLAAENGKHAIEVYKTNKDDIDLVILDMIMPRMSGKETYNRLKEINPNIKVLLASGYSIDGQATEILDRGCNGFIQKPFHMNALSQKIKEILDNVHPEKVDFSPEQG